MSSHKKGPIENPFPGSVDAEFLSSLPKLEEELHKEFDLLREEAEEAEKEAESRAIRAAGRLAALVRKQKHLLSVALANGLSAAELDIQTEDGAVIVDGSKASSSAFVIKDPLKTSIDMFPDVADVPLPESDDDSLEATRVPPLPQTLPERTACRSLRF